MNKKIHAACRQPLAWAVAACFALSGCAGYNAKVTSTVDAAKAGSPDLALAELEKNNTSKDKDLLYFFEKGELLRMKSDYATSVNSWMAADAKVREWEEAVKTDPSKLMGQVGSFIVNDTMRRYDGRDYEKVLLSVRLAMNHVALGDWDNARVEIKKMHEREAIIADYRAKDLEDAKQKANEKGVKASSFKDINGYPVDTLNDPGVASLKNAYESAIANYLAGFVYEALGEPSLAAAGYRKAIEMRSGDKLLTEALAGLDARAGKRGMAAGGVDTLFIVESGNAPRILSRNFPMMLPIPGKNGVQFVMTPLSWPVVEKADIGFIPSSLTVDDKPLPVTLVTSVDHMARKAISDEMPGIIARTAVRAIVKGAAQRAIQDSGGGLAGSLLSIAAGVAAVASEQADERTWRTLPGTFSLGRAVLPFGAHKITMQTPMGPVTKDVELSGRYALVVLRTSGNALYLSQTPFDPNLKPVVVRAPEPLIKGKPEAKADGKPEAKAKPKAKADTATKEKVSLTAN